MTKSWEEVLPPSGSKTGKYASPHLLPQPAARPHSQHALHSASVPNASVPNASVPNASVPNASVLNASAVD
eukprot:736904-Prymnesium_polylepis.1